MNKFFILLVINFVLCLILFGQDKIVIMNFKTNGVDNEYGEIANELITTTIVENNKWSVVERNQLNQILKEMKLTSTDEFDDSQSIEIGKLAKAQYILLGSISKIGSKYSISGKITNIQTAQIEISKKVLVESIEYLYDGIENLGNLLCGNVVEQKIVSKEREKSRDDKEDNNRKNRKKDKLNKSKVEEEESIDDVDFVIEKKNINPKYKFLTNDFVSILRQNDRNFIKLNKVENVKNLVIVPNKDIIIEKLYLNIKPGKNFSNKEEIVLKKDREYIIEFSKKPATITSISVKYLNKDHNSKSKTIIKYYVF